MTARIEHPGLVYPDEFTIRQNRRRAAKKFHTAPVANPANNVQDWGYTANQIAQKIKVSTSAARQLLHRYAVTYIIGKTEKNASVLYFEKSRVDRILAGREPEFNKIPKDHVTTKELASILGISATSLARLCQRNYTLGKLVKIKSLSKGRVYRIYSAGDVKALIRAHQSNH